MVTHDTSSAETPAAHGPKPSALQTLFGYKAWANDELLTVLGGIEAPAHQTVVHTTLRVLNHAHVVDCIFKGHLSGEPHGHTATNTRDTPTLQALAAAVREVDAWYISYVAGLSAASLDERVRFTFTDGDSGLMTREEILLHVIAHGGYHRGQAGQVMRGASVAPPLDLYTRFLHDSEPGRRA
jgi:uncharacterized damage-inducible protein DinB